MFVALAGSGCQRAEDVASVRASAVGAGQMQCTPSVVIDTGVSPPVRCDNPCSVDFYASDSVVALTGDDLADFVDQTSSGVPSSTGPEIDICGYNSEIAGCQSGEVAALLAAYPCNDSCGSGGAFVLCGQGAPALTTGQIRVTSLEVAGSIPLASSTHAYIYSTAQDSDGAGGNNWVARLPFDADPYQGTDRWHQVTYDRLSGSWRLATYELDAAGVPQLVTSSVRAIFAGNRLYFVEQASELSVARTPYRGVAFRHDGTFTTSSRAADVTGVSASSPLIVPAT